MSTVETGARSALESGASSATETAHTSELELRQARVRRCRYMDLRECAALLWRGILRTDPDAIFESEAARLLNRNWADRLPQPGYIGARYRSGGLVFVSMNPGAGPREGFSAEDVRQYRALERLRDADDGDLRAVFDDFTTVLADIMPTWKIHRNFVVPVLDAAQLDFTQVAYVNLLKWRTKASSGLARLYAISWHNHTRAQLELLAPSRVIAIGSDAGRAFQRHYAGAVDFDFIPRAIGNNVGPAGRAALARLAAAGRHVSDSGGTPAGGKARTNSR